jgi:cytochrome c-type biogenesis protein CcmH/NrfG
MDPRTALNRAMRLRATDRAEHALEIAEALVRCFPDREDFEIFHHLTRAALLHANGERDKALTLWEDVLRLDPTNDEARTAIGGGTSTATQRSGLSKFLGRFRGG